VSHTAHSRYQRCLTLNNFSTLFSVLAGLNSSTIMRLSRTWNVGRSVDRFEARQ
jgi:hypothetical protein